MSNFDLVDIELSVKTNIDNIKQTNIIKENLYKLESHPELYLQYLNNNHVIDIINNIQDTLSLEYSSYNFHNYYYNDDRIYNYLSNKTIHKSYIDWSVKYPSIWSRLTNNVFNNDILSKLVKICNYIHFDIEYDISLLDDFDIMINYLNNNFELLIRENEIDKRNMYISMLCLYIQESFKRNTNHYISIINLAIDNIDNIWNDHNKILIFYCLYNKYFNNDLKLRLDIIIQSYRFISINDYILTYDYKIDIKEKYYTKKISYREIKHYINIDFNKDIQFYNFIFSEYIDINYLFDYIKTSKNNIYINIFDDNAIYFGINKMYNLGLNQIIENIDISKKIIYLNKIDFNKLRLDDINLITKILEDNIFDFDLIHKICNNIRIIINHIIHNKSHIIFIHNIILHYLEMNYGNIIEIYNNIISLNDDYIKKCKYILLSYLTTNINDIYANIKYINLRYHHHNNTSDNISN